jgi:hypothetical protein
MDTKLKANSWPLECSYTESQEYIFLYFKLGVEVAKNLILAGPKQVTIYDSRKVSIEDIGRNFYCRLEHVGKNSRAEASLDQLKDLNPNVHVSIATEDSI